MKRHSPTPHATRVVLGTLAALALLAAASAAATSAPVTSDQFAPGWQAHAKPLFFMGPMRSTDRDTYRVPAILPRGDYVLVRRIGDKAELIGTGFTVTSANVDQYLFLWPGEGDVLALPIEDVPTLKSARGPAIAR